MKFSVFCEQTRKLFDTFLHPVEGEDESRRPRPSSPPTTNSKPKTYSYTAPSRRTSAARSDVRMFSTDSKRRRRAAALLYKSSVMRRSWQTLNQQPHLAKNQTTTYITSSMTGSTPYGPYSSFTEEMVRKTENESAELRSPPSLPHSVVASHAICSNECMTGSAVARDDNPVTTSGDSLKPPLLRLPEQTSSSIGNGKLPSTTTTMTQTGDAAPPTASLSSTTTASKRLQDSSQVLQSNASSVTYSCISSVSSPPPPPPPPPTLKSFESQGNQVHSLNSVVVGRKAASDNKKEIAGVSDGMKEMRWSQVGEAAVDDGSSTSSSVSSASSSALFSGSRFPLSATESPSPQDVNCTDGRQKDNKSRDDLMKSTIGKNKHNNKSQDGSHAKANAALLVRKARRGGFSSRIIRKHSLSRDRHQTLQPRDHVTIDIREEFTPEKGSVIKVTVKEKAGPQSTAVTERCPRLQFNSHQEPDVVDQLSVLTVDCKHDVLASGDGKEERGSPASYSSSCCSSSSPASSSTSAYFSSTSSPPSSITSTALQFKTGILKDRSNFSAKGCLTLPSGRVVNAFPKKVHFAESSINVYSCVDGNPHANHRSSMTSETLNGIASGSSRSYSNTGSDERHLFCSSPVPTPPPPPSPPTKSQLGSKARSPGSALTSAPPNRSVKAMISHFNSKGLDLTAGAGGATLNKGSPDPQNTERPSNRPTNNSSPTISDANTTSPVLLSSSTQDVGREEGANEKLRTGISPSIRTRTSVRKHDLAASADTVPAQQSRPSFTSSSCIYLEDARKQQPSVPRSTFLSSDTNQSDRQSQSEKTVTQHFRSVHSTISPHSHSIEKQISSLRQHYPASAASSSPPFVTSTPVSSYCLSSSRSEDRPNCVIHTAV